MSLSKLFYICLLLATIRYVDDLLMVSLIDGFDTYLVPRHHQAVFFICFASTAASHFHNVYYLYNLVYFILFQINETMKLYPIKSAFALN